MAETVIVVILLREGLEGEIRSQFLSAHERMREAAWPHKSHFADFSYMQAIPTSPTLWIAGPAVAWIYAHLIIGEDLVGECHAEAHPQLSHVLILRCYLHALGFAHWLRPWPLLGHGHRQQSLSRSLMLKSQSSPRCSS